jgi:hypothetical protein
MALSSVSPYDREKWQCYAALAVGIAVWFALFFIAEALVDYNRGRPWW